MRVGIIEEADRAVEELVRSIIEEGAERLEPLMARTFKTSAGPVYSGLKFSHDTVGFQFVNVPFGLCFHAHT
jgi:hypothetical protein